MNKNIIFSSFNKLNLKEGKHLLAFSAGPDSVFLLILLKDYYQESLKDHIAIIYVNYHDSPYVNKEEEIVNYYVKKYNIHLFKKDVYPPKENFEIWAREIRYTFFKEIITKYSYLDVLTAHQKDDLIETYLLQKERKNLPLVYGLNNESEIFNIIVKRPLLMISKKEIINYLDNNSILYYDDITNYDEHTKRNTIRKNLKEEEKEELYKEINEKNEELFSLYNYFSSLTFPLSYNIYESLKIEEKKRLLFYILERFSLNKPNIVSLSYEFLKGKKNKKLVLNDKVTLYSSKEDFIFLNTRKDYYYTFTENKLYKTDYFSLDLTHRDNFNIKSFPIFLRPYKKGDKIATNIQTKDVYNFLKKQKIPSYYKDIYPVFLNDNQEIFYVPFYEDILNKKLPFSFTV